MYLGGDFRYTIIGAGKWGREGKVANEGNIIKLVTVAVNWGLMWGKCFRVFLD